ncbi:cytochrome P450 9e2-like [Hylaeus anthracinus]|uniref:cytochrome P450 9e2-like n=1 Tax=Hylaeus anthracinus TaxID=313031 RepID=UPI0023B8C825|nr:cytochrome P450 9e2-like [Hylaeus anthracinus]
MFDTMEASTLSAFTVLVITLITICLGKIASIIYRQRTYWKKYGVPYVNVTPVLGSIGKVLLRRAAFHDELNYYYKSYPDARYVCMMDFATPTVFIRDPELIKELAIKNFDFLPNHRSFINEEIDPIFGRNVFSLKGDRWREMRNTLSPFFTSSKMRFMFGLVSKCSYQFVDYLYNHPECCTRVEAKETFTRYATDVIATTAFGISVNSLKDRDNEFYKTGVDAANFTGVFRLFKFLLFRLNAPLMRTMGLTFMARSSMDCMWKAITESVKARDEQGVVRPDMIHLLMQARDKQDENSRMKIGDIVANAFIFFLAGFDTASTLMCHVIFELALNREIQERLRKEVDHYTSEGNGEIVYEDLMKMEYMDMVMSETLRKYPPVMFTDRLCAEKLELPPAGPGYNCATVYPDELIWIPILALHHDPKYFPSPEKFDPERFSEKNKDNIVPNTYIPFGLGPRKCIANRFALMEAKILVAHILQKFVITSNEKTKPLVYKNGSFQLVPKDGFWLSFEKRDY